MRKSILIAYLGLVACNPNGNPQPTPPSVIEYRQTVKTVHERDLGVFGFACGNGGKGMYYEHPKSHHPSNLVAVADTAEECATGAYVGMSKIGVPTYDRRSRAIVQCHNGRLLAYARGDRNSYGKFVVTRDDEKCATTRLVVTE